jgi:muramidase (phage lysozyme)
MRLKPMLKPYLQGCVKGYKMAAIWLHRAYIRLKFERHRRSIRRDVLLGGMVSIAMLMLFVQAYNTRHGRGFFFPDDPVNAKVPPLVMRGGDPYIRALMRTISESEANVPHPYAVVYGGQYINDLSHHPDVCETIANGPNAGDCSTAAGRYQMLLTTWIEKSKHYHPQMSGLFWRKSYSFEPEYQDVVVYNWLRDRAAWGVDISELLQQDRLDEVLELLSGTWTSLGYGIEDNDMTHQLPEIYRQVLAEELAEQSLK